MKKLVPLLLVLALCIGVTSGCDAREKTASHTYQDLSISIPTDFLNLSEKSFAADYEFLYAKDPVTISGLRDEKAALAAYGLQWTLEDYSKFLMISNGVVSALERKEGLCTFSYEAGGYIYVVTLWETEEAFWTVQAYCPTTEYNNAKDYMWEILNSVTA